MIHTPQAHKQSWIHRPRHVGGRPRLGLTFEQSMEFESRSDCSMIRQKSIGRNTHALYVSRTLMQQECSFHSTPPPSKYTLRIATAPGPSLVHCPERCNIANPKDVETLSIHTQLDCADTLSTADSMQLPLECNGRVQKEATSYASASSTRGYQSR